MLPSKTVRTLAEFADAPSFQARFDREATRRGHPRRTAYAAAGGWLGGMVGSFRGPMTAALGAFVGALVGAFVGHRLDETDHGERLERRPPVARGGRGVGAAVEPEYFRVPEETAPVSMQRDPQRDD
jgi:uncharacterized protein YcfJ